MDRYRSCLQSFLRSGRDDFAHTFAISPLRHFRSANKSGSVRPQDRSWTAIALGSRHTLKSDMCVRACVLYFSGCPTDRVQTLMSVNVVTRSSNLLIVYSFGFCAVIDALISARITIPRDLFRS